jgi:alkanesulfonate monooxygenase SsuD/methylene tetrahydromethanopterin reductase-like flavin-dependent oxidoreductase (luciferase family)
VLVRLMVEGQEDVSWEQWLALAEAAERSGLDALFRSDHYGSVFGIPGRGSLDAWAVLAALAARTERIRLGTLVSPVTFRHPAVLAKMAVTVDRISGGRVELGVGAGWNEAEHQAHGFPFPPLGERLTLLEEQLETVRRLFSEDDTSTWPKPVQEPGPPLIMGGQAGPRAAALAARYADEYNTFLSVEPDIPGVRRRLAEACERIGRDPATLRSSVMATVCIGADRSELLERARLILRRFDDPDGDPEELLETRAGGWIAGTPAQAVERLQELAAEGIEAVYLQHLAHEDVGLVELVGAEIVPAVS